MNPKTILTEDGWDKVAPDCNGKDKELRRALLFYWSLEDDDFDFRCKALGKIATLAGALKTANEINSDRDAVKHLTDVISASKVKQNELLKAKAEAEKKVKAESEKKGGVEAKKREQEEQKAQKGQEEEDEDETGDSVEKLKRLLQSLKTSKVPYHFLACDAKPYGLVVSKRSIKSSAQHKKELAKVAGGSTRPPKFGTCVRDGNNLIFEMEKPAPGLARVLQKWLKVNLGIPFKVTVGGESADDEEGRPEAGQPKAAEEKQKPLVAEQPKGGEQQPKPAPAEAPSKPPTEKEVEVLEDRRREFKKARATWVAVKIKAEQDLEKVKDGVRTAYIADAKQFPKVVQGCKDIDDILDNLDDELRDTLDQYASTPIRNQAKLHNLAATAREILDGYQEYVANNALMKAIDMKEFADVTVHAPVMKALNDLRKTLS